MLKKTDETVIHARKSLSALWAKTGLEIRPTLATVAAFFLATAAAVMGRSFSAPVFVGQFLVLLLLYALFLFAYSRVLTGRQMSTGEVYMMAALTAFYLVAAACVRDIRLFDGFMPTSIVLPTALAVMLPALLIQGRLSMVMALVLPHAALLSGSFNVTAYILSLSSGVTASLVVRNARERMDMIKSGLIVALVNSLAMTGILLVQNCPPLFCPGILLWTAVNGLVSGMLTLGILPLFENALHQATTFRLIELLDLNTPLMERLAQSAPGTFAHSEAVARLAEAACQEIGANGLLARVGAYYHDIGKIESPEYFVENQTLGNKHTLLDNPRLSATVIRSHVKLGIEKGRNLGLPNEIIEIIASHHGNSIIEYFYAEAVKREGDQVTAEDFTYPGHPPHRKEAAVVMLADVTEAAARTLDKPSVPRLEKFIQGLITRKVESGQLAECELTFRELEVIKKSFVRTLAAMNHARIEYPKIPAAASEAAAAGQEEKNAPG